MYKFSDSLQNPILNSPHWFPPVVILIYKWTCQNRRRQLQLHNNTVIHQQCTDILITLLGCFLCVCIFGEHDLILDDEYRLTYCWLVLLRNPHTHMHTHPLTQRKTFKSSVNVKPHRVYYLFLVHSSFRN